MLTLPIPRKPYWHARWLSISAAPRQRVQGEIFQSEIWGWSFGLGWKSFAKNTLAKSFLLSNGPIRSSNRQNQPIWWVICWRCFDLTRARAIDDLAWGLSDVVRPSFEANRGSPRFKIAGGCARRTSLGTPGFVGGKRRSGPRSPAKTSMSAPIGRQLVRLWMQNELRSILILSS